MNRREFILLGGAGLAGSVLGAPAIHGRGWKLDNGLGSPNAQARVVKIPPAGAGNSLYPGNRAPLLPSPFMKLPIGAIEPRGWVRQQLLLMADGMTGNLASLSKFLEPSSGWMTFKAGNEGWEELPYWLRGFGDLGYVLKNQRIDSEARLWLDAALASQQPDGYFGPPGNKAKDDLWPNMLMLNAFQSLYEATGDERVLPVMTKYFRYEHALPKKALLPESWQKIRGGDNLASVYWLYNRTGERWLLDLAAALHEQTADWTAGLPTQHGVNNTEGFREPATYYQQAKDRRFLEATESDYATVMKEYGQVPGGMFAADENFRPGYTGPSQAAETCSMVEYMHSFEMLLKITGDPVWAERCENVAFNSFPAAMTPDLKGLHYLTAPNLVQCDPAKDHVFQNKDYMVPFSPREVYRCCQHNVAMGWPYYAEHLWLAAPGNGLAAVLYAASAVDATVGDGVEVRIEEGTDYPFGEAVELRLTTPGPVKFPLYLRIPSWAEGATVAVNGKSAGVEPSPQSYVVLERAWQDGDRVSLQLPIKLAVSVWKTQANSVSVNLGPLSYSLKIGEKWEKLSGTDEWPDLAVYPTSPWNVGLEADRTNPSASFQVQKKSKLADQPFTLDSAPVELSAKGRVLPDWKLVENCAGPLPKSPVNSNESPLDVTLVPMGCARLRISVFPTLT
jgi:hypothetical protein